MPRAVPRRTAASVGWWGLLLVAASLGVVALMGTSTFERVGRRDSALRALTAGLQQPTETLLIKELSLPDGGTRVSARADLVAFDIDRAAALADPQAAARAAAESRVAELIGSVNGASDTYVRSFEAAAAQPLSIARTAALGLLAGGAIYRFITLARNFRESRR